MIWVHQVINISFYQLIIIKNGCSLVLMPTIVPEALILSLKFPDTVLKYLSKYIFQNNNHVPQALFKLENVDSIRILKCGMSVFQGSVQSSPAQCSPGFTTCRPSLLSIPPLPHYFDGREGKSPSLEMEVSNMADVQKNDMVG